MIDILELYPDSYDVNKTTLQTLEVKETINSLETDKSLTNIEVESEIQSYPNSDNGKVTKTIEVNDPIGNYSELTDTKQINPEYRKTINPE